MKNTLRVSKYLQISCDKIIYLILALIIFISYYRILGHGFINLDDTVQVTANKNVLSGITWENILWSFTPKSPCSPLTWLTYAATINFFGLKPRIFHSISLLLHIANSSLLFYGLKRMTGDFWKSFIVSTLFAIHPINVESVAWIAEVNNVLSGLFFILTLIVYHIYTRKSDYKRYVLMALVFELGLLSKPTIMTLPFILFLFDYWPLGRIHFEKQKNKICVTGVPIPKLVLEKLPLLFLSFISFIGTALQHAKHTTFHSLSQVPMSFRINNALVSYLKYLGKMFWPFHLGVLYPYPNTIPLWQTAGAVIVLIAITTLALWSFLRRPYYLVGWLWFLGALVPFLGIIQSGIWPEMADRYAYITLIGIFIILSWGASDLISLIRTRTIAYAANAMVGVIICLLALSTWVQAGYWKDSITLFEHVLTLNPNNEPAQGDLGAALLDQGDTKGAIYHLLEALKIHPNSSKTYFNLGVAYSQQNEKEKAIACFSHALVIDPNDWEAINVIGDIYVSMNDIGHAVTYYIKLAKLRQQQGNPGDAINGYKKALRIQPKSVQALYGLSLTYLSIQNYSKALEVLQSIREIQPKDPTIYYNIACVYAKQNMVNEAVSWLGKAVQMGFSNYDLIMTDPDLARIRDTKLINDILKSVNAKSMIK